MFIAYLVILVMGIIVLNLILKERQSQEEILKLTTHLLISQKDTMQKTMQYIQEKEQGKLIEDNFRGKLKRFDDKLGEMLKKNYELEETIKDLRRPKPLFEQGDIAYHKIIPDKIYIVTRANWNGCNWTYYVKDNKGCTSILEEFELRKKQK
ncbi:MAG: hypothetical protein PHY56_00260 [Candidatus Omnitrophica bacterium]|nr:hypothetical protein [Candidatus Omnitrophota bacterium]